MADASTPISSLSAVIIGHSFVKRLARWLVLHHVVNFNVDADRIEVFLHGVSGACASTTGVRRNRSLIGEASLVRDLSASIVVIDIGSNDLCLPGVEPDSLVRSIFSLVDLCFAHGARFVVVAEVLPRRGRPVFNDKVAASNRLLAEACTGSPCTYFWRHRKNNFNTRFLTDFVSRDGVHVDNLRGMPKYFMSMRGAILFAERRLAELISLD